MFVEETRDVELERMIKDSNSDGSGGSGIFGFLFGTKPKPESKPIEVKKDEQRDFGSAIKVTEEISEREMQQIKLISTYFTLIPSILFCLLMLVI